MEAVANKQDKIKLSESTLSYLKHIGQSIDVLESLIYFSDESSSKKFREFYRFLVKLYSENKISEPTLNKLLSVFIENMIAHQANTLISAKLKKVFEDAIQ